MAGTPVTNVGGPDRSFPTTLWSMVLGAHDTRTSQHLERLCRMYWKPVYWLIRFRWNRNNEDAKDLTQDFFLHAFLEKDALRSVSQDRGRFRAFVQAALKHFMLNRVRDENRLKRGGGIRLHSLDDPESPLFDLLAKSGSYEDAFDRVWSGSLMEEAIELLREQYRESGRANTFLVFEKHNLIEGPPPSYADLARALGITEDAVRGALRRVRKDLRAILRDHVLQSLADPKEVDAEMNHLFGAPSEQ